MVTWDRTPLGLETAAPYQARAALAVEGSERRWNLNWKVPALHREAERDTTGSFSRQPLLHTWNGRRVQGKRRRAATLRLIRPKCVKLRLTLWFYCGTRAARRHGFVGEPRKSWCFAGLRASVRRSIAVFRRHPGRSLPRIFPLPLTPAWPAMPGKPASSSISTRPFSFALSRWPIRTGWSSISLRSAFSLPPEPAPRGAD